MQLIIPVYWLISAGMSGQTGDHLVSLLTTRLPEFHMRSLAQPDHSAMTWCNLSVVTLEIAKRNVIILVSQLNKSRWSN